MFLLSKLFQSSLPYKADGRTIFLYRSVPVTGFKPRCLAPIPFIAKKALRPRSHDCSTDFVFFLFDACMIPRWFAWSLIGILLLLT